MQTRKRKTKKEGVGLPQDVVTGHDGIPVIGIWDPPPPPPPPPGGDDDDIVMPEDAGR